MVEYLIILLVVVAAAFILIPALRQQLGVIVVWFAGRMDALVPLGLPPPVVDVDFGVHHLGDGVFSGSWGFTQQDEGTSWTQDFDVNGDPALANSATIQLNATGVQCNNKVYINGVFVGYLNSNGQVTISIPPGILQPGNNSITIESVDEGATYDDFEVSNIQILFN